LVSLKTEVGEDSLPTSKLTSDALLTAREIGSSATTVEEAMEDEKFKNLFEEARKKINQRSTSRAQVIQKIGILPVDFSEKGGELTPTLKLKRGPTAEKHQDLIESLYA